MLSQENRIQVIVVKIYIRQPASSNAGGNRTLKVEDQKITMINLCQGLISKKFNKICSTYSIMTIFKISSSLRRNLSLEMRNLRGNMLTMSVCTPFLAVLEKYNDDISRSINPQLEEHRISLAMVEAMKSSIAVHLQMLKHSYQFPWNEMKIKQKAGHGRVTRMTDSAPMLYYGRRSI